MYPKKWKSAVVAAVAAAGLAGNVVASPTSTSTSPAPVTLTQGVVHGTSTMLADTTVNKYLGIPYAHATRFEKAISVGASGADIDATQWGDKCPQTNTGSAAMLDGEVDDSEDCLFVNVYAPETAASVGNKTVLVWIYGGGLQTGNSGRAEYDGSSFAANQDIILVSFNYRLNVFGFSNSPAIAAEDTNVGFWDQRLALEWIYANIGAFGGNRDSIVLMGESSGAASVDRLVVNPPNVPIHGAIMQSGQASVSASADHTGVQKWTELATAVKCSNDDALAELSCMQSVDATLLQQTVEQLSLNFFPVNDNITQSGTPLVDAIKEGGKGAHVPLMVGTNAYEGSLFVAPYLQSAIDASGNVNTTMLASTIESFGILPDAISGVVKPFLDSLLLISPSHLLMSLSTIVTSLIFKCPAKEVAHAHLYASDMPVYRYLYSATFDNTQQGHLIPALDITNIGAYHSAEIPIVFGTYSVYDSVSPSTEDQKALSRVMQTHWADFAKNPINPGFEEWNRVSHSHTHDMACFGCDAAPAGIKSMSEWEIDGDCLLFDTLLKADKPLFK